MQWTAWSALAALLVYAWMFTKVVLARGKYKVKSPDINGPIEFQRIYRVQINTVEQMVIFFPALLMCSFFLGDRWAALGGAVWAVGRIIYAIGYYQDAGKRATGFAITLLATLGLMIGTAIGLLIH